MKNFHHTFVVQAPIRDIAEFHQNSNALVKLTPPPIRVEMVEPQRITEGMKISFVMWIGPIPVHWTAVHEYVHPQTGFDDIQVEGPFKTWRHKHRFISLSTEMTEIRDEIEAEIGSGWWNYLVSWSFWISLPILFSYRAWVTKRTLMKK